MAYNGNQKFKIARMPQWQDGCDISLSISGTKTMDDKSGWIQRISNNSGGAQDVLLPEGKDGMCVIVSNAGADNLVVKDPTGVTTIGTVASGKGHMFVFSAEQNSWYNLFLGN